MIDGMESSLENITENLEEENEIIEKEEHRLDIIQKALGKVREDGIISEFLEKKADQKSEQLAESKQKLETISQQLIGFSEELADRMGEIREDRAVLKELSSMGEDVGEADSLLADEEQKIHGLMNQIEEIAEQYNLSAHFPRAQKVNPAIRPFSEFEKSVKVKPKLGSGSSSGGSSSGSFPEPPERVLER